MENTRLFMGLLAVDLAFGFVLGWASVSMPDGGGEEAADLAGQPESAGEAAAVAPSFDRSALADLDVSELRERVAELERDVALYTQLEQTYEVALHGEPPAWPAELEEKYTPDGFRAVVDQAVRECDLAMELVGFDCAEPPCYAHFVGDAQEAGLAACPVWVEAFGGSASSASDRLDCEDGSSRRTWLVAPDMDFLWEPDDEERGFDANSWKRFSKRTRDAQQTLACPQDGGTP